VLARRTHARLVPLGSAAALAADGGQVLRLDMNKFNKLWENL
jgi:hypothetical protein